MCIPARLCPRPLRLPRLPRSSGRWYWGVLFDSKILIDIFQLFCANKIFVNVQGASEAGLVDIFPSATCSTRFK